MHSIIDPPMFDYLVAFLNSNFFIAAITFLGGLVAYFLYQRNVSDAKVAAATTLLLEIQNAERGIREVETNVLNGDLPNRLLMPTESWTANKHLFARDFDRDEWDTLSRFYIDCALFDAAVNLNASYFQKNEEQIRVQMHMATAMYLREYLDGPETDAEQSATEKDPRLASAYQKALKFQELYLAKVGILLYSPQKPLGDARTVMNRIAKTITQNSIGSKLKRLARM